VRRNFLSPIPIPLDEFDKETRRERADEAGQTHKKANFKVKRTKQIAKTSDDEKQVLVLEAFFLHSTSFFSSDPRPGRSLC
jgi:hypothetical protein